MQIVLRATLTIIILLSSNLAAKELSTGNLKFNKVEVKAKINNPVKSSEDYLNILDDDSNVDSLKDRIQAMRMILFNRPPKEGLNSLQIRYATVNLRLVNVIRTNTAKPTKNEQIAITAALRAAKYVLKNKLSTKDEKAVAYYLSGMALVYNQSAIKAIQQFKRSLDIEGTSEQSLSMLIFLGEYYFETRKFSTAEYYYKQAYELKREDHKNFVRYKLAWTYMNQNKNKLAEKTFLEAVRQDEGKPFVRESTNDLAYLIALTKNESQIISFIDKEFKGRSEKKKDFITLTSAFLSERGKFGNMPLLIKMVLSYQVKATDKVKVKLLVLANQRKKYASKKHAKSFVEVVDEIRNNNLTEKNSEYQAIVPEVITEAEALIKSLSETYNGSLKTPEKYSKNKIAEDLMAILEIYRDLFKNAENFEVVTNVLLGLCLDRKNYLCLESVTRQVLSEERMAKLHGQATLDRIEALGELSKNKPKKYKGEYIDLLNTYLNTKSKDGVWVNIAKRLTVAYIESGRHKDALPWSQEIYKLEKSDESLYRVNISRFNLGQYENVIDLKTDSAKGKKLSEVEIKLLELKREATLKLVIQAKEKGDQQKYEDNIYSFLKLRPEGKKASIVIRDFIQSLDDKKDYDRMAEVWSLVDPKERGSDNYRDLLLLVSYKLLKEAYFRQSYGILNDVVSTSSEVKYLSVLSKLGYRNKLSDSDFKDIYSMKLEHREYILELLSVADPNIMAKYFWKFKKHSRKVKQLMLLSLKLKQGKEKLDLSFREKQRLDEILPTAMKAQPRTQTEKVLIGIRFPASKSKIEDSIQLVQKAAAELSRARTIIASDLENSPLEVRSRILETAIRNERKMAQTILNSPIPGNLNKGDKQKYKNELKTMANQYFTQADEYVDVNRQVKKLMKKVDSDQGFVTLVELDDWPWPANSTGKSIKRFIDAGNLFGSLILCDLNLGQKRITNGEYWTLRAGALIQRWKNWQGLNYVKAELKNAGQITLLDFLNGKS